MLRFGAKCARVFGWMLALGLVGIVGAHAQAPQASGLTLKIPYNSVSTNITPLWVAHETGLFKRYGIETTVVGPMQSPAVIASMLSGETPFSYVGPDAVINADLAGGDLKILATGPEVVFSMYAAKSLPDASALKGKKIGITRFGTTTDFVTRFILGKIGLRVGADVTLVPLENSSNIVSALVGSAVDAGMLADDFVTFQSKKLTNFRPVASMHDYELRYYSATLIGKTSWMDAHPDETLNVMRAYLAGIATVFNDEAATLAVIGKYTKTNDADILKLGYAQVKSVLPKVPVPQAAVLQSLLDASDKPAAKAADPASFIDASAVMKLEQNGYIAGLYK